MNAFIKEPATPNNKGYGEGVERASDNGPLVEHRLGA